MFKRPLRFVTFLAPNVYPLYEFITRRVAEQLDWPTELAVGESYEELADPPDFSFVCGLAYVALGRRGEAPVEPIAAPLLQGGRYDGRPVYYSDVIVHRDSPAQSFADLRGRSWAYNEPYSHSGYGVTRYHLVRLGETNGFFGKVVEAGWHERSVHLVSRGEVDGSAIDSQVLALMLREQPELAEHVRVIDTLGPSTIQPVVAARHLPESLKVELRDLLLGLGDDAAARPHLDRACVERFVPVSDADYADVRAMLAACEDADFLTLR
jgi:phosphonate transport system substrate-binding protein